MVTGCNTGLGQGMAVALAQAGADIVGVNVAAPGDTPSPSRRWVASFWICAPIWRCRLHRRAGGSRHGTFGHAGHPGQQRRHHPPRDAIKFSEKDWDDVIDLNLKTVFFSLASGAQSSSWRRARAARSSMWPRCCPSRAACGCPSYTASKSGVMGITRFMANEWAATASTSTPLRPATWPPTTPLRLRADEGATRPSWSASPPIVGGCPEDLAGPVVFLASQGVRLRQWLHGGSGRRWMAAGWRDRARALRRGVLSHVREQAHRAFCLCCPLCWGFCCSSCFRS
jgi:2-deoxy-D-gluconate 3-dehydrogenase